MTKQSNRVVHFCMCVYSRIIKARENNTLLYCYQKLRYSNSSSKEKTNMAIAYAMLCTRRKNETEQECIHRHVVKLLMIIEKTKTGEKNFAQRDMTQKKMTREEREEYCVLHTKHPIDSNLSIMNTNFHRCSIMGTR